MSTRSRMVNKLWFICILKYNTATTVVNMMRLNNTTLNKKNDHRSIRSSMILPKQSSNTGKTKLYVAQMCIHIQVVLDVYTYIGGKSINIKKIKKIINTIFRVMITSGEQEGGFG